MSIVILRDYWCCIDCTMLECNDDPSGMSEETHAKCIAGFDRLTAPLSANFDSETNDGIREFSSCGCDVCGSRLAGTFHRFALMGEKP